MKIQNKLPHMRNGSVKVKGQTISCDANGFAEAPQEIAEILLRNKSAWRSIGVPIPRKPIEEKVDLEIMTKAELIEHAAMRGISVDPKSKKQELIDVINSQTE